MRLQFSKYHGTGNDFILIDNREGKISLSNDAVASLCHRHFGVGADGLILLEAAPDADFRMIYYNCDGKQSTMCGNGGRCLVAFAQRLGITGDGNGTFGFLAVDGPHSAVVEPDGRISLLMQDVDSIEHLDGYSLLNTGSPHFVQWVEAVADRLVAAEGRSIRHWSEFEPDGINVNFIEAEETDLIVRTYERGVEAETLSCGTGVCAAAIAATADEIGTFRMPIRTLGGMLEVTFTKDTPTSARNVILTGPAAFVFDGSIEIEG